MSDARRLPEPKLPERPKPATPKVVSETSTPKPAVCSICGRERTAADFGYDPIQVYWGNALGWYSSEEDGELCPDDIGKLIKRANS